MKYSDIMRGLLSLYLSIAMNAAAPDGAQPRSGSVTKFKKKSNPAGPGETLRRGFFEDCTIFVNLE